MKWAKLTECNFSTIQRGWLLKFPAAYPFESEVVMMVCGYPDQGNRLGAASLITISGYSSGVNAYVVFPEEAAHPDTGISRDWLISNWNKWVWPDCDVSCVLVRSELSSTEL